MIYTHMPSIRITPITASRLLATIGRPQYIFSINPLGPPFKPTMAKGRCPSSLDLHTASSPLSILFTLSVHLHDTILGHPPKRLTYNLLLYERRTIWDVLFPFLARTAGAGVSVLLAPSVALEEWMLERWLVNDEDCSADEDGLGSSRTRECPWVLVMFFSGTLVD